MEIRKKPRHVRAHLSGAAAGAGAHVGRLDLHPARRGQIATTVAGYTHNPRKLRVAGMFINSPLWIVYDVATGSLAGVMDELVTEISMIVSILRFGWKALDRAEE